MSRHSKSDLPAHHRPGGGFRNPWPGASVHGGGDLLRWWWERRRNPPPPDPSPDSFPRATPAFLAPRAPRERLGVTWVGHSSLLLQIDGRNVLTDPVWSERASPVPFAGPKRRVPAAVPFESLPPIDVVLISHNHYDHLDDATVRRLARAHPEAAWAVPLGVAEFVRARGAREVAELDWWEEQPLGGLVVGCAPAQHFSARSLRDRAATLWCSWAVWSPRPGGPRAYFGGDSGLHPEFARIGARFGPFDLALIPVGAYEPRWFMRPVHMNPEDAVQAYRAIASAAPSRAIAMVPIHWGTFRLTDEPLDEPPRRTAEVWRKAGLPEKLLWVLRHGETRWRTGD